MANSLKIDAYRMALLPISFLLEYNDKVEKYCLDAGIDSAYCDVVSTGLWVYPLHVYHGLVRDSFGAEAERIIRRQQRVIFDEEHRGAGQAIDSALSLIEQGLTSKGGTPFATPAVFETSRERRIALALLLGLPESPDYLFAKAPLADATVLKQPGTDDRLANLLSRSRKEILKTFEPVLKEFTLEVEPVLWASPSPKRLII